MNAREKCDSALKTLEESMKKICDIRRILGDTVEVDFASYGNITCFDDQISALKIQIGNLQELVESLHRYIGGECDMVERVEERYPTDGPQPGCEKRIY